MSDLQSTESAPSESLATMAQIIYGLHSLSILIGLTSALTIVGAFVFGVPSIVAVFLNYVYQSGTRGTWLESHFRWQIRTFWFAALWIFAGWVVFVTLFIVLVGIPMAWAIWVATGFWVIYRVARGWLTLQDRKPMPS